MELRRIIQTNRDYTARQTTHLDRDYIVLPVVMMREGVHHGSQGPILHLAEELGRFPESWNGIPVLENHPQIDGQYVSANSVQVSDKQVFGRVYNVHMDGDRLRAEVWIEVERANSISPTLLQRFNNSEAMDVSIGAFTDNEDKQGEHNGEQYIGIARNYRPDHLALLPEAQGACSYQDGCGIRTNQKTNDMKKIQLPVYTGTETETFKQEKNTEPSNHLLIVNSEKEGSEDELKYQVVNNGKLNKNALEHAAESEDKEVAGMARYLLFKEFGKFEVDSKHLKQLAGQGYAVNQITTNQEYTAVMNQLQRMLDDMDYDGKLHWLEALYETEFIYKVADNGSTRYFRRGYSIREDDSVEMTGEPIAVRKEINYVPISGQNNNQNEEDKMSKNSKCCPEKVDALINNTSTKFTESDREWLSEQTPEMIEKMTPEMNSNVLKSALSGYTKAEEVVELMPQGMQETMKQGLASYKAEREKLVKAIQDNTEEGTWKQEELEGMNFNMLEKIAKSLQKNEADYSAAGAATPQANASDEVAPLEDYTIEQKSE
jgi:hypothetical protein